MDFWTFTVFALLFLAVVYSLLGINDTLHEILKELKRWDSP